MKCWFCSVREAQQEDAYELNMYGEVDAKSTDSKTDVAYSVRHVEIPRCPDCHSKHRFAKAANWFAVVFLALLLAAVLSIVFNWVGPLAAGLWSGIAAGLLAAALLSGVFVQKGIHTVRAAKAKYPEIEELKNECYRFGTRPNQALPTSDPPCESRKEPGDVPNQDVQS